MLQPKQETYVPAFTGIRAIAAFMVYFYHVPPVSRNSLGISQYFLEGCFAGVTVFFVLSGFLIAYKYTPVFQSSFRGYRQFLISRFARIYPLYLVLTVITLLWKNNYEYWHWIINLTLAKSFYHTTGGISGIGQAWSLTVEATFYLITPWLFRMFRKIKFFTIILFLVLGCGVTYLSHKAGFEVFMDSYKHMFQATFFGRCFEFYCGYKLAAFIKKHPETKSKTGANFTFWGCLLTISGIFLVGYLAGFTHWQFPVSLQAVCNNFVLPLAIVVWFYGLISEKTYLSNLLSSRLFQVLGKGSYAFYLIHTGWTYELIYFHISTNKFIIFIVLNLAAIGIYYLFEEPVNRYLRKKYDAWEMRKKVNRESGFLKQNA